MTGRRTGEPDELLRAEGISVWLSGREVLHDVGFTLRRGEFAALIGSNGAGKTTLLKVILGLQAPSAGTVRLAGQPRSRHHPLIGYVPQKIQLDPDLPLRARDLVGLGLDGQRLGIPLPSASRRKRIDEMLQAVGADGFGDARVGNLSGGEQQRVLIAHALISRPQLLLLDEPLANLDIASEQDVVQLLGRVAREQQIAVLISAHDMNPLLPVMDRIIYLAAGRAASGTTAEVVRTDVLSALYGQHVDVIRVHDRILVVAGRGEGQPVPPDPAIHPDGPAVGDRAAPPEVAGPHDPQAAATPDHATTADQAATPEQAATAEQATAAEQATTARGG
jgi:zinc/manganese transport system ATP-binding protein